MATKQIHEMAKAEGRMKMTYRYENNWGGLVEVSPNSIREDGHDLFIEVTGGKGCGRGYVNIKGKEEILEFIYAAAVNGGIIEEGEPFFYTPKKREVPASGGYLVQAASWTAIGFVADGKLYVYEAGDAGRAGKFVDRTNEYQSPANEWSLEFVAGGNQ